MNKLFHYTMTGAMALSVYAVNAQGVLAEDPEVRVEEVTAGDVQVFGYNAGTAMTAFSENGMANPIFLVYPDTAVTAEEADALLEEMGLFARADEEFGKAYVINPTDGEYGDDDAEAFVSLLDQLTPMAMNTKLIGIGEGATFVNTKLNDKLWSVAGVMTYGGEAGGELKYGVPAYVSNGDASQYKAAAVSKYEVVVEGAEGETLAEAAQNAWDQVFVKNGRIGNITGTFYTMATSKERPFEYFSYLNCETMGLERTVVADVDFDGDGIMNLWYEYVPEAAKNAADGTVPLVVLLHGNGNDPRTQANTSGWPRVAAKEGFILVEPEWQGGTVNGVQYDAMVTDDSVGAAESDIQKFVETICEKYPQIDTTRMYMEGLSRGARNSLNYGLMNPSLYAAVGAHSGGIATASIDFEALTASMKASAEEYQMPIYMIAGIVDEVCHMDRGFEDSDLMLALQYYEEMNGMEITQVEDLEKTADNVFGVKFDKEGYVENDGSQGLYNGTLIAEDGTQISMNSVTNWGHWNYDACAEDMWKFFTQFSRVDGVLYVNGVSTEKTEDTPVVEPEDPAEEPAEQPEVKPQTGVNTGDGFNAGVLGGMAMAGAGLAAAVWFSLKNKK